MTFTLFSSLSLAAPSVGGIPVSEAEVFYQCQYYASHDTSNRYLVTLKGDASCLGVNLAEYLVRNSNLDSYLVSQKSVMCNPVRGVEDPLQGSLEHYWDMYNYMKNDIPLSEPDLQQQITIETEARRYGIDKLVWKTHEEGKQKCEVLLAKESMPWAINSATPSRANIMAFTGYAVLGLYPIYDYVSYYTKGWLINPFPKFFKFFRLISTEQLLFLAGVKLMEIGIAKMHRKAKGTAVTFDSESVKTE